MGRPKGSRNKAFSETLAMAASMPGTEVAAVAAEIMPDRATLTLTDEDLAPIRQRQALHSKAEAKLREETARAEIADKEIGEARTVVQVVEFDMSGAFVKAARQKAIAAGYSSIQNLRKTPEGWKFEAFNETPHQP